MNLCVSPSAVHAPPAADARPSVGRPPRHGDEALPARPAYWVGWMKNVAGRWTPVCAARKLPDLWDSLAVTWVVGEVVAVAVVPQLGKVPQLAFGALPVVPGDDDDDDDDQGDEAEDDNGGDS